MTANAYIALDFETANGKRTSICSVGMVKVINHQITESFYTLVNPNDYFSKQNIAVHGINPNDVKDAPTFESVYPYMMQFIDGLPVVAHNAAFDMNVLYESIKQIGQETPTITYFCSLQLSRKTINSHRYGLSHMMNYYNLDFHGHHDALNDAKACAMITFRLLQHYDDLNSMLSIFGKQLKDKD
ncbi:MULTISPECIES: 3'-5' exonuclease [Staphylococcus]|uniref:DNA polymerase III subunit epsilon n=1 Tax=Staphylococcus ureilyticus TaxID=94138 RepID=A0AB34ALJ2_STAUR|nr:MULTISPECIES: 3'-5' exonuclease [Staphylococcus]AVL77858.1 DNA polymerase III subunit epsilon [Staphylococcus cohnii]MBL0377159.1 3'-5' exonuclease [Staphylococcus sp. S75]MBL0383885.1 3'-5' exonuclease [Staphylococcus sp. S59]MBL0400635.1 3'-5' exonuclease [Staphylococcus sp. S36]MCT1915187.1 3'-5' exonuclease [Staphylococcus ureilyticus]